MPQESKNFTHNASAAMMMAQVSRTSEEKGFPRRRDRCFTHALPIRSRFLVMSRRAWFLENFLKQADMAARPYLQDEIIPTTEWGTHLKASIYFPFTLS